MEITDKLAVLIDADNAQPSIVDSLLAEIAHYGVASVKRIYGDWTSPGRKAGKKFCYSTLFNLCSSLPTPKEKTQPTVP
jgi:hypothetical protein